MPHTATLFLLHCIENAHIGKWHWHFVWNRKATNRTPLNLPPIWSMQPTKHPCNVYLQLSSSLQWTLSVHLSEWNLQRDSQCVETAKAGTGDAWTEGKHLYYSSSVSSSSFTFVINTWTCALWSSLHSDVHLLCALHCNKVRFVALQRIAVKAGLAAPGAAAKHLTYIGPHQGGFSSPPPPPLLLSSPGGASSFWLSSSFLLSRSPFWSRWSSSLA